MTAVLVIPETQKRQDDELAQALGKVVWPISYGSVTIKLRDGKPVLVTIEKTLKLD